MPVTQRDKNRLNALFTIVRPARSFAARVEMLSAEQRDWYDGWKAHFRQWTQQNGERAYELVLDNLGPSELREDISIALFGETPRILESETDDGAADIYQEYFR